MCDNDNAGQGMIRLEPAAFKSVAALPLWAGLEGHLAVASVLSGTVPGSVYFDDSGAPRSVLVQAGDRFHLGGSPAGDAWRRSLRSFLLRQANPPRPEMEGCISDFWIT